jgi:hypothetical protein
LKLPPDIIANLNRELSRHQRPEDLDWQLVNGKWTATEEARTFIVIHDETLGYVIAEQKSHSYELHMHRG